MKNRKILCTAILSLIACFAFSRQTRAACDSPDPGCPGGNLAEGYLALGGLTSGTYNTGIGAFSLLSLTDGSLNTAVGAGSLLSNTGVGNTAIGAGALFSNTTAGINTAVGEFALFTYNGNLGFNTAVGASALLNATTGQFNTAVGQGALSSLTTALTNVAIGLGAGSQLETGGGNVFIGVIGTASDEGNHTYIRNIKDTTDLGTGTIQFVLVNQDTGLLGRSTVSVNEFLKAHQKIEEQQASIAELKSTIAEQQKGMEVLTAQLKEQGEQIQKVSARLEVNRPAPQVVTSGP